MTDQAVTDRAVSDSAVTDPWHATLRHVRGAQLSPQSSPIPGMKRAEAVSTRTVGSTTVWMGQIYVAPGSTSGDHHHGDTETAIYVVSGHPVFVFAEGPDEVRIEAEPGDYVFVPPFAPHREENPGPEEAIVVLARSSQEGISVSLPSLWPDAEEGAPRNGASGT
jgi:uncharacterized RmlC-like cupin family protein